jgi:hypothetical protein
MNPQVLVSPAGHGIERRLMGRTRLNLQAIAQSLRHVQQEFPKINATLRSRSDSMTDEVLDNMMSGYAFVDWAIADDADILEPAVRGRTAGAQLHRSVRV